MFTLLCSFVSAANETASIREIKLRYCNGTGAVTKSLVLQTEPNKEETICLEFSNWASSDVRVGLNFVDGTLTADDDQRKACQPESTKEFFGQYVTGYENSFIVPKKGKKKIKALLKFPEWYAGTSYGCATYFLGDDPKETVTAAASNSKSKSMFSIFTRVGTFIDAMVDGEFHPELIVLPVEWARFHDRGHNSWFIIYPDGWSYKVRGYLYNTGNIAVSWNITVWRSSRRGLFGQNKKSYDQIVLPRQGKVVDMKLPWTATWLLGMNVHTNLSVNYSPIYLWEYNTNDTTQSYKLTTTNKSFFFPWIIVIILIVIRVSIKVYKKMKEKREQKKQHNNNEAPIK